MNDNFIYFLVDNPEFNKEYDWDKLYNDQLEYLKKLQEEGYVIDHSNIYDLAQDRTQSIISKTYKRYLLEQQMTDENNYEKQLEKIKNRKDFVQFVNS